MNSTPQSPALCSIDITVTLKAPWLVHGSEPGRYGLDASMLRNHEGFPILPGSLISGRIRAAWKEMNEEMGFSGGHGNVGV